MFVVASVGCWAFSPSLEIHIHLAVGGKQHIHIHPHCGGPPKGWPPFVNALPLLCHQTDDI